MTINIWRNFINKPRLKNDVSLVAEVSYSHYGPTFAIAGTLSAPNTVILVHNICIEITNTANQSLHFMDWFAFRPDQYQMGNLSEVNLTMTSKFTIASKKKHNYNVLFIDNNCFSQMKTLLQATKDAWKESKIISAKNNRIINSETLFREFKNLKLTTDAIKRLKTITYWDPGSYLVKIRVTTQNPKQIFDTQKSFILTPAEAKILSTNAENIIANICEQPHRAYFCATPSLITKE